MGASHGHENGHAHGHGGRGHGSRGHAGHVHAGESSNARRLGAVLVLVMLYMVAELIGGYVANSLALLADAGHMLSDAGALIVSVLAVRMARRAASPTHTFGYLRTEILAALLNGALLIAISLYVVIAAIGRLDEPPHVVGPIMLAVAAGGLVINLASLWILHGGSDNLNVRGAWLHVLSDAFGSAGAIVSGVLILAFGWYWADPIASLLISALVVYSAWSLLAETVRVLMQAVPGHIDLNELENELLAVEGVRAIHDLHVWSITSGRVVMSAHAELVGGADRKEVMNAITSVMRDRFGVHHSTVQLECPEGCEPCSPRTAHGDRFGPGGHPPAEERRERSMSNP